MENKKVKLTNNDKNYIEEYAMSVIKNEYSYYCNLIKSESPDFANEKIGLEVTRAIRKEGAVYSFLNRNIGKEYEESQDKELCKLGFKEEMAVVPDTSNLYCKRSKNNGSFYYMKKTTNKYALVAYIGIVKDNDFTLSEIETAVKDKLSKLNNNYSIYQENDLAILINEQLNLTDDEYRKQNIEGLANKALNLIDDLNSNNKYKNKFDKIFLVFIDCLIMVDICRHKYEYSFR